MRILQCLLSILFTVAIASASFAQERVEDDIIPILLAVSMKGKESPIAHGGSHSCALLSSGSVSCWGSNRKHDLGNGGTSDSDVPVMVNGITDATAIALGGGHSCALLSSGSVSCWGYNAHGQLGNGTTLWEGSTPVVVKGIKGATAIALGDDTSCALLGSGSVPCWGSNLGQGVNADSSVPVTENGIKDATAIAAGAFFYCALLNSGSVSCWGSNAQGQLGDGHTSDSSSMAVIANGITDAIAIAAGSHHICALLGSGSVSCWGFNASGQLGNGGTSNSNVPVTVAGITGAIAIAASDNLNCALLDSGSTFCWGRPN